ncbi:MAG TPA: hypothetical protein VMR52_08895 [Dehalococcoidia bacterium]|nr:hypothetical protein [Dehalococcoidia bacterium]
MSDRALDLIASAIDAEDVTDDQALRLARTPEGEFGLVLVDGPDSDDQVVKRDDKPVLYVANEVAISLDGAMLDVAEDTTPPRLTLRVPDPGSSNHS